MKKVDSVKYFAIAGLVTLAAFATAFPALGDRLLLHLDGDAASLFWQLFTCHLVHWTPEHLFYDVICFVALGVLLPRRKLLFTLLLSAPAVSLSVLLLHPELQTYGGLSGVNCALFTVYALDIAREHSALGIAALAGLLLKTLLEIALGQTFFATTGFLPVHSAHLAGLAIGILCQYLLQSKSLPSAKCQEFA